MDGQARSGKGTTQSLDFLGLSVEEYTACELNSFTPGRPLGDFP